MSKKNSIKTFSFYEKNKTIENVLKRYYRYYRHHMKKKIEINRKKKKERKLTK